MNFERERDRERQRETERQRASSTTMQPAGPHEHQRPVRLQVLSELGFGNESVVWVGKLVKVNRTGKSQERTIVLTKR